MGQTKIEWANKVWNPITGCSPISEGCQNCYAQRMANRLRGRYGYPKDDPFRVTFHPARLNEPLHWKKSSRIFVSSMGDIFHEDVKPEWIDEIWEVMAACHQHTFMVLTKRPQNIERLLYGVTEECGCRELGGGDYLFNLWLGVSVENQRTAAERIPILLQIPAAKRFISVEPMLSEVHLKLWRRGVSGKSGLDWVICGGETGPKTRPMNPDWARSLRDQCQTAGVPFFFKGMMITRGYEKIPHKTYLLDGKEWREFPKQEVIKNE